MKQYLRLPHILLFITLLHVLNITATSSYTVDSVVGDPLKAKIYTLQNGLKVYLSVNKEQPRIQCYIAVRSGSKNDPHETTGLAHYFEHLMFKGTERFGTSNYTAEKPLLNKIEALYETYRHTTDRKARRSIYHQIDSISQVASTYNIPNEYDKLMAGIGAKGSNAYTSYDQTVYEEDIPANELERWLIIQSDRFRHNVIRGFHTELEAVYEEKNISMTRDNNKVIDKSFSLLFPHHPYGTQTILGTQEELKNPSITNIRNFYHIWYVPNNTAICLSGDINPTEVIKTIEKYFGTWQPNASLPQLQFEKEPANTTTQTATVVGREDESVTLSWRLPGNASPDIEKALLLSRLLYNGSTGLCDLELNQQQRIIGSYAFLYGLQDYSALLLIGQPKRGQKLERVKQLLLEEIKRLGEGRFDEKTLQAIINNLKLEKIKSQETNEGRASEFVDAFVNNISWEHAVNSLARMSKLTKADIVAYAKEFVNVNNYVCIFKERGIDTNEKKMPKPEITPIAANRDTSSNFLRDVLRMKIKPITPVFIDYLKDIAHLTSHKGLEVLYKQNVQNERFSMAYLFDFGSNNNKLLLPAIQYLPYLGTKDMTAEVIQKEFYRLGCQYEVEVQEKRTIIKLEGLGENIGAATRLLDKVLNEVQVNSEAYENLISDIIKSRDDDKLNQMSNARFLKYYAEYGEHSPATNILSENQLKATNPQTFVETIHNLCNYKHRVLYYGELTGNEILKLLDKSHKTPKVFNNDITPDPFKKLATPNNLVLIAPYDAKNIIMAQYSNNSESYSPLLEPQRTVFNAYFGDNTGMSTIVFQELRETRALAYTAYASMSKPSFLNQPYVMTTFIATQVDKMKEAATTFNEILKNMPVSETNFRLAKKSVLSNICSTRITKEDILWNYVHLKDLGITKDQRKDLFERIQKLTLSDLMNYHAKHVKGRHYTLYITGNEDELDLNFLQKYGTIKKLTQEQIFGY